MKRIHYLAAEVYAYSYANYEDHLGVNLRFDRLMPAMVRKLQRAEKESWTLKQLAQACDVDTDEAAALRDAFRAAKEVVDAPTPAASFRVAVRQVIEHAIEKGLKDDKAIRDLVVQICYRAADLAFLLDENKEKLSKYSRELRTEPDFPDTIDDLDEANE